MSAKISTLPVSVLVLWMGIGCASVDTGRSDPGQWPDDPERPWEQLEGPSAPTAQGWDQEEPASVEADGPSTAIFDLGYQFYVRGLTQIDGPRCEHRPTCSRFAHEAVRKHGVIIGSMLAVDRLMRSDRSSIHRRLPTHSIHQGSMYYDDPVEANDFFL